MNKRDCFLHTLLEIQEHEDWLTDDFIFGVVMDLINTCRFSLIFTNYLLYFWCSPILNSKISISTVEAGKLWCTDVKCLKQCNFNNANLGNP